jgi:integrase
MTRRAKTIDKWDLLKILEMMPYHSMDPMRDSVAVLLSFRAGMRVGEIAGIEWRDVLTRDGHLSHEIQIRGETSKNNRDRKVPMHPLINVVLLGLLRRDFVGMTPSGPIIQSLRNPGEPLTANALQKYLARLYRAMGYDLTSHSGRRSAITALARMHTQHGCSIYDVQSFAGHADISTTEMYVDRSEKLIDLVKAL